MSLTKHLREGRFNSPDDIHKDASVLEEERLVYRLLTSKAQRLFKRIAGGSSRVVYEYKDNYVIKVAKNKKGEAQNEFEYELNKHGWFDDILTRIYYTAHDYRFLISEKAVPLKENPKGKATFQRITGVEWDVFNYDVLESLKNRKYPVTPNIEENEFVQSVQTMVIDYDIPVADMQRIEHWGLVNRDGKQELVLIDSGLSREILNTFYRRGW